jgi:hypothetical protein
MKAEGVTVAQATSLERIWRLIEFMGYEFLNELLKLPVRPDLERLFAIFEDVK